MAFSVKGDITIRKADGTDYSSPNADAGRFTIPEETDVTLFRTGTYIFDTPTQDLYPETVIYGFVVKNNNTDSTFVTITYTDSASVSRTQVCLAGGWTAHYDPQGVTSLRIVTGTGTVEGELTVWGKATS